MVDLFQQAGITKAEYARRANIQPGTISSWKGNVPGYAVAYLELLIRHNQMRDIIGEAIR